ncbi:MAG TPA: hypothetical protein VHW60_14980, partial [Caulobacteraceae bacterium]|nr:hypothetical protein [Caulobacteraceae bacterium]
MKPACALLALSATAILAACSRSPSGPPPAPPNVLDAQVAHAIGDPNTCVLLADAATGKIVYRYGDDANCTRQLPACDSPATMNAHDALKFATQAGGRMQSCPSVPDGSRSVGWAEGKAPSTKRNLIYSAVMEGADALPGHEINARL